jgi:hypothetical protein
MYFKMKKVHLSFFAVALFLFTSCLTNVEREDTDTFEQVSFRNDVFPILDTYCVGCHGATGGVNMSTYQNLMSSTGNNWGTDVVIPGNASGSGLIDVLNSNPQFNLSRMPIGGPYLTANEIELISTWINEGALDN